MSFNLKQLIKDLGEKLPEVVLCLYFFFYILAGVVTQSVSVQSMIKLALLSLLAFIIIRKKTYSHHMADTIFCVGIILMTGVEIIVNNSMGVSKLCLNVLFYYIFASYLPGDSIRYLTNCYKILGLMASASLIYLIVSHGLFVYFRDDAIVDKQYMTAVLTMCSIVSLVDFSSGDRRRLNFSLFAFFTLVAFIIVRSKLTVFVEVCIMAILVLFIGGEYKRSIHKLVYPFIILFVVAAILFPDIIFPDDFKQLFNRYLGTDFHTERDFSATYDIRGLLWRDGFDKIFCNNMIWGIGPGEFAEYNTGENTIFSGVKEMESSMLTIICEGGLVYLSLILLFFCNLVYKSYILYKMTKNRYAITCLSILISYFLLLFGNDFMDTFFWVAMGVISSFLRYSLSHPLAEVK